MVMLNSAVSSGETPLAALIVKLNVPATVGVPEIKLPLKDNPSGKLPESTVHMMGVSPVAVRVWL
jgi:hypothetical protein